MTGKDLYLEFNKAIGFTKAVPFEELPPIYTQAWNMIKWYADKNRLFKIHDTTPIRRCSRCHQMSTDTISGPIKCISLGIEYADGHEWVSMKLEVITDAKEKATK
jgi:hypothetical protein